MPGPGIITDGVSRTGCVPRLTPPLRGQPFQAGRGVFACLGLAPEQLGCLGQHQRVRAAELPDLMLDWQLGGADLVPDVLAAGLGERPLQRALAAVGEEPAECEAIEGLYAPGVDADPVAVAEEITRILALPVGSKPHRSVIDFTQSHVDEINAINEKEASDFVTRMGFGELLELKH